MVTSIILFSIIMILFIIFDLIPIFHEKQWKAFWVYVILISLVYVISILYAFDIKLPSPAEPIKKLVSFVFGIKE